VDPVVFEEASATLAQDDEQASRLTLTTRSLGTTRERVVRPGASDRKP
jgi:hypothetical protein